MYLSCDENNGALSLTGAASVDPRIQFTTKGVRGRERSSWKVCNDMCD